MKKSIIYFLPLCLMLISSCSGFLDENPKSFLSPESFYKTEDDLNAALNAVYRAPHDRYSDNWAGPSWFEWATDEAEITDKNNWSYHNEIARLSSTFNASSSVPSWFWSYTYNHVKDANNLLEALPDTPVSEDKKQLIEGQTKALRALLYFDAVQVFGSLPLILKSSTDINYLKTIKRADPNDIYEAIISDLQFAISVLPTSWSGSDKGRISSGGAAALLAKVYLTMAGYPLKQTEKLQDAKTIFSDFVEAKKYGSQYALLSNYSDLFNEQTGPGDEGVWVIDFTRGTFGQGNQLHTEFAPLELYYAPGIGLTYGGGWSNALPTMKFYNSYDTINDKRFAYNFWTSTAAFPNEYDDLVPHDDAGNPVHIEFYRPHCKKFREVTPNDNSQGSGLDVSIIRYADVLLMYAEVLNELGDNSSYTYINQVRARAGLAPLSGLSQDEFREAIVQERMWELCFEGIRRFDLVRWGVYTTRTPLWNPQVHDNIKTGKHELWPVPQSEIDLNAELTQNPGW